ncbi:MAG: hypothetical protein KC613_06475 [Myxococcales bacterium]|nr:hypothetical protein [Myxococcales bacterium]
MRRAVAGLALLATVAGCDALVTGGYATAPEDLPTSARTAPHDVGHVLWRGSALTGVGARFALHQGTAFVLLFTGAGYDEDLAPVEAAWHALRVNVQTGEITEDPSPPLPLQGPIALNLRLQVSPDGRTVAGVYDGDTGPAAVVAAAGEPWVAATLPADVDPSQLRLGAGSILVPGSDGIGRSVGAQQITVDPAAVIPEWAAAEPRHIAAWDGATARVVYGPDRRQLCTAALDADGLLAPPRCVDFVTGHGDLVGAAVGTPQAAHFALDVSLEYGPGMVGLYTAGPDGLAEVGRHPSVVPVGDHQGSGLLFAAPGGGEQLLVVGAGALTAVNTDSDLYRRYPGPACQCVGERTCACSDRDLATLDWALDGPTSGALLGYDPVRDGRHAIMLWGKDNFPQHDPDAVGMGTGGGDGRAVVTVDATRCDGGPVTEAMEALGEVALPWTQEAPGRHRVDPNGAYTLHLRGPADADPPWVPEAVEIDDLAAGVETPAGAFVLTRGWALGALYGDETFPAATGHAAHVHGPDGWLALTWADDAPVLTPLAPGPGPCVLLPGNALAWCTDDGSLVQVPGGARTPPDPARAGTLTILNAHVVALGGDLYRVDGDQLERTLRTEAHTHFEAASPDGRTALLWTAERGLEVTRGIDGPRFLVHPEQPQQVMITDDGQRAVVLHNTAGLGQLTACNLQPLDRGEAPVLHRFSQGYERIPGGGAAMDPVTGRVIFANNRLPENGEPAVVAYDSMALGDDPEGGRPDPWEIQLSQPMTYMGGGECDGGFCFVLDTRTLIVFDMAQGAEVARLAGYTRTPQIWRGMDRGPYYHHDAEMTWFEWAGDGFEPVWTDARGLAPVAIPSEVTVHQDRGILTLQRGDDELQVRTPIDGSPAAAYDPRHLQPDWWAMPCALYRHTQLPASGAVEDWRCVR